ncbi:hypothetical protein QR680_013984 [Steinernema hermaphroditum]|uniref:Uncharacterized protein n=1 Tax=Steinernema hermaphroditum TaxID=289476 RepID=A0AA39I9Y0_9BILA|nr:hypothetical protein QR680_013984 [Steinernema hermaphroditum]
MVADPFRSSSPVVLLLPSYRRAAAEVRANAGTVVISAVFAPSAPLYHGEAPAPALTSAAEETWARARASLFPGLSCPDAVVNDLSTSPGTSIIQHRRARLPWQQQA